MAAHSELEEIFNESLSQPPDPDPLYLMPVCLQGQYLESSKIIPHCQTFTQSGVLVADSNRYLSPYIRQYVLCPIALT